MASQKKKTQPQADNTKPGVNKPVPKARKVFLVNGNINHNGVSYQVGQEVTNEDVYFLVLHNQGFLTSKEND